MKRLASLSHGLLGCLFVICLNTTGCTTANPASLPVTLSNPHITIECLIPNAETGHYRGERFDWSGMTRRITVGDTEFMTEWKSESNPDHHDANALGTAEEFGIHAPPGYDDVLPGEPFLKIGVGVLRRSKQNRDYMFWIPHKVIDYGSWEVENTKTKITYTHKIDHSDWGYVYTKSISLQAHSPGFTIARSLKNTGIQIINTTHYGHHYFMISGHLVGPSYQLRLPAIPIPLSINPKDYALDGRILTPRVPVGLGKKSPYALHAKPLFKKQQYPIAFDLEIRETTSGASIAIIGDVPLERIELYAVKKAFSPEAFTRIHVEPGETMNWSTTYTFRTTPLPNSLMQPTP